MYKQPDLIILAALHDSHLTPPTSDHQSGDDNSVCNVEVNSLAQCLSRTRELTRSLTKRIETDHEVGTVGTYHFNRLSVQLKNCFYHQYLLDAQYGVL